MKAAIMQPYFLPYIGYFQLMNAVDKFVIYDNIEFVKKGWINRNRFLLNGKDILFTIPLKKASDFSDIRERELSGDYEKEAGKILRKLEAAYGRAPYYNEAFPVIEECFKFPGSRNLFEFIKHSLTGIREYLNISSELLVSSAVETGAERLKGKNRVIQVCKLLNTDIYINPIGGVNLYNKDEFKDEGIQLHFLKSNPVQYSQHGSPFVPWLSIIDVMMFNSAAEISSMLNQYELI